MLTARIASKRRMQVFSFDLLVNAVVAGILLGGFYAAVSLGISMSFGLLEVANIAHPVFVIAGAYAAYMDEYRCWS
jgi:branched-chain amino acid transport system permease protein